LVIKVIKVGVNQQRFGIQLSETCVKWRATEKAWRNFGGIINIGTSE
jgi:hypothetical protein